MRIRRESLQERAERWNSRGWRIFPVVDQTKRPAIVDYHGRTAFSSEEISRWPWAVAGDLGLAIPPCYVVLDIDVKNGARGEESMRLLTELYGPLPATARQETRSGGYHLLFRVPESIKCRGRVARPDGAPSGIDICTNRNRYVVIYDEAFLNAEVADLPEAWFACVARPSKSIGQTSPGSPAPRRTVAGSLLDELREAQVGSRNDTLNRVAFMLALSEQWEEQRQQVLAIAMELELDQDEIDATVQSAVRAANHVRAPFDRWLEAAEQQLVGRQRSVRMAAQALHALAIVHGNRVSLSLRDLAQGAGVSHATAGNWLSRLVGLGLLRAESPSNRAFATSYELVPPVSAELDTQPASGELPAAATGRVSKEVRNRAAELFRHDAFIKVRGSVHLTKSCAWVLASVEAGADSVAAIASATELNRSTIRRAAHVLASAGLLTYDSVGSRRVAPGFDDLDFALDQWATWSGAEGNSEWLRLQHTWDRKAYAEYRQGKEDEILKLPNPRWTPDPQLLRRSRRLDGPETMKP